MLGLLAAGLLALATGCAIDIAASGSESAGGMKEPPLYECLGKKEALNTVVDDFVNRVTVDSRINGLAT